jgi:cystathionine beta-lyase/cystathionine gamma-synthase
MNKEHFETLCVHAGVEPEPVSGAIMTPIFQTSTYVQSAPAEHKGYDYSRAGNPTRDALEKSLAALEGAKQAISFASGLAAEQALIQTLQPGDEVIVSQDVYGGTGRLFRRLWAKYGLQFHFVDMRDHARVEKVMTGRTRMIWVETPTNPLMQIIDIGAMSALAKRTGAKVVVDNTFCSPALQQPLSLGADAVVHSSTKYIGGHSDLIGGAVMTSDDALAEQVRFIQFAGGAVNAPFECFLLLRSIKTLAIRMKQHSENAMRFARALEDSGSFREVLYPGLESHPQHELAKKQMRAFSGMVSVYLDGGYDRVKRFLQSLRLFALAESLGGVESLVNHPEKMTHASVPPELREELGITGELVRFSVGIENVDDLIADVQQALRR